MPKKKPQRNGLYWFMQDLMPELRREGLNFPNGMSDVVPVAAPRWKALPQATRERYEKKAKDEKKKNLGSREVDKYRLDNKGNIIADRVDPAEELEQRRLKEGKISRSRWPQDDDEFLDHNFYLMSFEHLWKAEEDRVTLPVEVGMVEFSLRSGIKNTYQCFIKTQTGTGGRIPMGRRFQCKQQSEDRHQIPLDDFKLATDNYCGIWIQMENFVNDGGKKREYPPIYVIRSELETAEYCMNWLHSHSSVGQANRLSKLFELETMVLDLFGRKNLPISRGGVTDLLTSTNYDYASNTRCTFHDDVEIDTRFCALATVKKFCYHLSDGLAQFYDIELTEQHLPPQSATQFFTYFNPDTPSPAPLNRREPPRHHDRRDPPPPQMPNKNYWNPAPPVSNPAPATLGPAPSTKPRLYSSFASRDIRYRGTDLDDLEEPQEAGGAGDSWPTLGEAVHGKQNGNVPSPMDMFTENAPSLHDVIRRQEARNTASRQPTTAAMPSGIGMPPSGMGMPPSGMGMPPSGMGMPPSGPAPTLHEAVADKEREMKYNVMQGVRRNDNVTPQGRGIGRGRGRGKPDVPRTVNVGPIIDPYEAAVQTVSEIGVGRGRGTLGAPCPVNVSGLPDEVLFLPSGSVAAPPPLRRPVSTSKVLTAQPAGRGRGNFRSDAQSAPRPAASRPPPGFGRGVTVELSEMSLSD